MGSLISVLGDVVSLQDKLQQITADDAASERLRVNAVAWLAAFQSDIGRSPAVGDESFQVVAATMRLAWFGWRVVRRDQQKGVVIRRNHYGLEMQFSGQKLFYDFKHDGLYLADGSYPAYDLVSLSPPGDSLPPVTEDLMRRANIGWRVVVADGTEGFVFSTNPAASRLSALLDEWSFYYDFADAGKCSRPSRNIVVLERPAITVGHLKGAATGWKVITAENQEGVVRRNASGSLFVDFYSGTVIYPHELAGMPKQGGVGRIVDLFPVLEGT